jgi:ubiquitin carboxyl-terminal hydrolase 14
VADDKCAPALPLFRLTCDEAPDETPTRLTEAVPKLDCNISITTNYLHQGILASLDQKIEKHSPTLGRTAVYTQKSRLERLPDVLTVHLVRFYWRRDTNSKAKIMCVFVSSIDPVLPLARLTRLPFPCRRRRVKFPHEYDVLDLCTDDLRKRLSPLNAALKQVAKDRDERARIRKRARTAANAITPAAAAADAEKADSTTADAAPADGAEAAEVYTGTPEEEAAKLAEERAKLASLIDANIRSDKGANASGLYELAAIVTHKGASADSGHYIGWGASHFTTPSPLGQA